MTDADAQNLALICLSGGCRDWFVFEQLSNFIQVGKNVDCPGVDIAGIAAQFVAAAATHSSDLERVRNYLDLTVLPSRNDTPSATPGWDINLVGQPSFIVGGADSDTTTTEIIDPLKVTVWAVDVSDYLVLQTLSLPYLKRVGQNLRIYGNLALSSVNLGLSSPFPLTVEFYVTVSWNFFLAALDLSKLDHAFSLTFEHNPNLATLNLDNFTHIAANSFSGIVIDSNHLTAISFPRMVKGTGNPACRITISNEAYLTSIAFALLDVSSSIEISNSSPTTISFPSLTTIGPAGQPGNLTFYALNGLLSFNFSALQTCKDDITIESCPNLIQVRFQSLTEQFGDFTVSNNASMVSFLLDVATTLGNLDIEQNPALIAISMPSITLLSSLRIRYNDALNHLQPLMTEANSIIITDNAGCTYIRFTNLQLVGQLTIDNCAGVNEIKLSALVGASYSLKKISITRCPSVNTVDLGTYVPANGDELRFNIGVWTGAFINSVLARCVSNPDYVSGVVDFSVNTFGPSGQGVIDKATLIARGVTVRTI